METNKDVLDRHHLLSFNRERIEQAYLQAKTKERMADPLILVVDPRDTIGNAIVAAHVGDAKCRDVVQKAAGAVPTVILAVELERAKDTLEQTSPKAREMLSRPLRPGTFWVVAVAQGGNSYAALPVPAYPSSTNDEFHQRNESMMIEEVTFVAEHQGELDVETSPASPRISNSVTTTFRVYRAGSRRAAIRFLRDIGVNQRLLYHVVETPEGNIGKDCEGMYEELPDGSTIPIGE